MVRTKCDGPSVGKAGNVTYGESRHRNPVVSLLDKQDLRQGVAERVSIADAR
jgi:hypothetical protein